MITTTIMILMLVMMMICYLFILKGMSVRRPCAYLVVQPESERYVWRKSFLSIILNAHRTHITLPKNGIVLDLSFDIPLHHWHPSLTQHHSSPYSCNRFTLANSLQHRFDLVKFPWSNLKYLCSSGSRWYATLSISNWMFTLQRFLEHIDSIFCADFYWWFIRLLVRVPNIRDGTTKPQNKTLMWKRSINDACFSRTLWV